jgi:hypothetical protein
MTVSILRDDLVCVGRARSDLGRYIELIVKYLPPDDAKELIDRLSRSVVMESQLFVKVYRPICRGECGRIPCDHPRLLIEDAGCVSRKVITNAGVNALIDAFQGLFALSNFRYHGIGIGTAAESVNDTALAAELTTQYAPDNTRATGTLGEGSASNIFQTVGTNTVDAAVTITEHGLFSAAQVGQGVLWDRSLLSPSQPLNAGDSIQATYQFTMNAGG